MYKRFLWVTMQGVLLLTLVSAASGTTISGVSFEPSKQIDDVQLSLRGAGVLTYLVFIDAYAGALYMPDGVSSKNVLADVPKHLEISYFHPISGDKFGPATLEGISRNIESKNLEILLSRIDYHNSLYEDVVPGDRYSLTYIPGKGTQLALNGVPKGVIEGADFAAAIFSIWLGRSPADRKFKQALLGN